MSSIEGKSVKRVVTIIVIVASILNISCSQKKTALYLSPMAAIEKSARSAPATVNGVFEMTIKSTECKQGMEFLNSEVDNLDQRNLIVALRPNAVRELTDKFGVNPEHYFVGKRIQVNGEAKRTKEWVLYKNKNIRRYFYQTKIFVRSADQVTVL